MLTFELQMGRGSIATITNFELHKLNYLKIIPENFKPRKRMKNREIFIHKKK